MKNKHIGSDFNDFLEEEGILVEAEVQATKRVLAYQLQQLMSKDKISKTKMAKKMHASRATLDRLLDPESTSMTLHTLESAAEVLGRRVHIELR